MEQIDYLAVSTASMILRAVNNKLRKNLIEVITSDRPVRVTDIYKKLSIAQSETSRHLSILRQANLVQTMKCKKEIRYTINYSAMSKLELFAAKMSQSNTA